MLAERNHRAPIRVTRTRTRTTRVTQCAVPGIRAVGHCECHRHDGIFRRKIDARTGAATANRVVGSLAAPASALPTALDSHQVDEKVSERHLLETAARGRPDHELAECNLLNERRVGRVGEPLRWR